MLLGVALGLPIAASAQEDWLGDLAAVRLATTMAERDTIVDRLLARDPDFEDLYAELARGPTFSRDASRGVVQGSNRTSDGSEHHFAFVVPDSYDPSLPIAVRFMLHGGVGTDDRQKGGRGPIENLRRVPEITVLPSSWRQDPWWSEIQVENLAAILQFLKRHYNVDPNRVHLAGVSDGAAGVYYVAMKDTTPWAGFLPFIGDPGVLRSVARESQLHLVNLRNKPFFVVNTGQDPLYPTQHARPSIEALRVGGVEVEFRSQEGFGHNTNWWPNERGNIARFVSERPREPHPATLDWAVDDSLSYNRAHWLVVRELSGVPRRPQRHDWNEIAGEPFSARRRTFGEVSVQRRGNVFEIESAGVRRLSLLLSPAVVDFSEAVRVVANGSTIHEGLPETSSRVLVEWWMRDRDRSMLYAAELVLDLGETVTSASDHGSQ